MQPMHTIPARGGLNYDETPFLAIWEITQSCDLACKHCRAAAQPLAHPDELTNTQAKILIDQISDMKIPIFVFTGGDPMKRKDIYELVEYASKKGVHVAVTPSATPLLTREAIFKMKAAGVVRLGISLDGSTPEIHDHFRGLSGAWERTIQAIGWAAEAGLPIQVHTTISRHNMNDLDNLCNLFETLNIVMWNVFFLIPVGRGQLDDLPTGEEFEQVFGKIYELSQRATFQVKTTEAMHYRRYLIQNKLEEKKAGHPGGHPGAPNNTQGRHDAARPGSPLNAHSDAALKGHDLSRAEKSVENDPGPSAPAYEGGDPLASTHERNMGWATRRVNDGKGFMFISHTGNVYPSGFLPIHAGNIKQTPLADIYREAPIFKALRDTSRLEGKCGACEFKEICGGSRARAYALTGDPLAAESCCIYQPKHWDPETEQTAEAFHHHEFEPLVKL